MSTATRVLALCAKDVSINESVLRRYACAPKPGWEEEISPAITTVQEKAEIRAAFRWLDPEAQRAIFRDLEKTPVSEIARRGRSAAFLITLGEKIDPTLQSLMDRGEHLKALFLDAAGSALLEATADLIQAREAGTSQRYSPGYCHWSLLAQRPLLDFLGSTPLGVEMRSSMQMWPLKSISGIMVWSSREHLMIPPECCQRCPAPGCSRRRAKPQEGRHDTP